MMLGPLRLHPFIGVHCISAQTPLGLQPVHIIVLRYGTNAFPLKHHLGSKKSIIFSIAFLISHWGMLPHFVQSLCVLPHFVRSLGVLPHFVRSLGVLPRLALSLGVLPCFTRSLGMLPRFARLLGMLPCLAWSLGVLPRFARSLHL